MPSDDRLFTHITKLDGDLEDACDNNDNDDEHDIDDC